MGLRSQNNPIASFRDVFSATGTDAAKAAPPGAPEGITATGGVISDYTVGNDIYRTHIFTSSGTFDVTKLSSAFPNEVDYLVVAGGGGGGYGSYTGGGGGGGGFRTSMPEAPGGPNTNAESKILASVQSYSITVGGGGGGGYSNNNDSATQGTPSYIGPTGAKIVESIGGGKGSDGPGQSGGPGGSGGGAAGDLQNTNAGPAVTPTQGFPGGSCQNSNAPSFAAGGGGGAGSAGVPGIPGVRSATNGDGGAGKRTTITGPAYSVGTPGPAGSGGYLAGGGATGSENPVSYRSGPQSPGPGGGGGGNNPGDSSNGLAQTGGGGGGGDPTGNNVSGGSGGSGIIVFRYQIGTTQTNTAKATGGAINFTPDGKTVHVFTSSGTFTAPTPLNPTPLSVEYLVVGGGGGGGSRVGTADALGGGGAGGLRSNHSDIPAPLRGGSYTITPGTEYTATVGAGGGGGINNPNATPNQRGQSGSSSEFYPTTSPYPSAERIRSTGGGGGGSYEADTSPNRNGIAGGSGGGGAGGSDGSGGAGNSPSDPNWPLPMGNPGGARGPNYGAGGGGGFISAGTASDPSNNPGPGGAGVNISISGSSTGYAGGGGGGACGPFRGSFTGGTATHGGGAGAPADGSNTATYRGDSGTMGTGGGGGGAGGSNSPEPVWGALSDGVRYGGNGGSGIVIISYPT